MALKLKARKMKSVADARKSSKGGGEDWIKFIPEDGITVRFLTEPDEWVSYTEHYDDELGFFPCVDGDCPGCDAGDSGSGRYLVAAVDREDDRAIVLKVPKSLAQDLVSKYDRRNTLMDRDYYLYKEGSGKNNTKYKVDDEDKTKFNFDKFTMPDLMAALESAWERTFSDADDEDDDDDDRPARRRAAKKGAKKGGATRRRPSNDDDDDDDDDDDEDETPRRRVAKKAPARKGAAKRPAKKSARRVRR